jgi:hypothetical protein
MGFPPPISAIRLGLHANFRPFINRVRWLLTCPAKVSQPVLENRGSMVG